MPMNLSGYPPDWREIRARVLQRDENKCKWCGVPNGMLIMRDEKGRWWEACIMDGEHFAFAGHSRPIKVVLTVAHLNHDKGDDEGTLAALCQRCHLNYDRRQHVSNAAVTRRLKKEALGQGCLL